MSATAPLPSEALAGPGQAPTLAVKPTPWWASPSFWLVAALTIFGGLVRFSRLDFPALWIDEGATFSRVIGTFNELLEILEFDGFLPLHYEIYWLLGRALPLNPHVMRLVPATAGTLMIPAMYFLARQFVSRRTALAVAAFTACSAFMLFYSRDAKMYMHLWFFLTLQVACLLHWLSTGKRLSWLTWISAGTAAAGLHASAMILWPIQLFFLLTYSRPKIKTLILFVLGMSVIAVGPTSYYVMFNKWSQRSGGIAPGVEVGIQEEQFRGWGSSGLQWIPGFHRGRITGPEMALNSASAYLVGWEWPTPYTRLRLDGAKQPILPPTVFVAGVATVSIFFSLTALGLLPWPRRRPPDESHRLPQPWWRSALWLAAWLILPVYALFYCRSVPQCTSPLDWLASIAGLLGWGWLLLIPMTVWLTWAAARWRPATLLTGLAVTFLAAGTIALSAYFGRWQWLAYWLELLEQPVIAWGLLLLVPALAWIGCGHTFRDRAKRTGQLLLIVVLILTLCLAAHYTWSWLWVISKRKLPTLEWQPIWVPRYSGIVFPAFAIALIALLMRLPTRPLRVAAIATLLGLNLANGVARIVIDTEPPLDRISADLWKSQIDRPHTRVFYHLPRNPRGNSNETIMTWEANYYICRASALDPSPKSFRSRKYLRAFRFTAGLSPKAIRNGMRLSSNVSTIVTWERIPRSAKPAPEQDPITTTLGDTWKLDSEQTWTCHGYWSWTAGDTYRRRQYVKQQPSSQPLQN